MVSLGFKDGALQYNPSTGALCVGCCEEPAEPCGNCPADTTPLTVTVTLADWTMPCSDCHRCLISTVSERCRLRESSEDIAALINGQHILTQVSAGEPCVWREIFTDITYEWEAFGSEGSCDSSICDEAVGSPGWSIVDDARLEIVLWKINAISVRLFLRIINPTSIPGLLGGVVSITNMDATTEGIELCIEVDSDGWSQTDTGARNDNNFMLPGTVEIDSED